MTTHELAKYLLEKTPDLPVVINGWGSNEGSDCEVTGACLCPGEEGGNIVALGYDDRNGKWELKYEKL